MSLQSHIPFSPMGVCICEYPYRLELSSFKPAGRLQSIHYSDAREARDFLKSQLHRPFVVQQLRALLASQNAGALHSDDAVWDEVAWRLSWGQLYLGRAEYSAPEAGATASADEAPAVAPPKRAAVSPPLPLPPPRKRLAEDVPAPAPEPTARLQQDVQAAALEQAARHGTPFCAVCEARAAAAAEPA